MRQDGFYWVLKENNKWVVGEWKNCNWYLCGIEKPFDTTDFIKIGFSLWHEEEINESI